MSKPPGVSFSKDPVKGLARYLAAKLIEHMAEMVEKLLGRGEQKKLKRVLAIECAIARALIAHALALAFVVTRERSKRFLQEFGKLRLVALTSSALGLRHALL